MTPEERRILRRHMREIGARGGRATQAKIAPEQRIENAKKASAARWSRQQTTKPEEVTMHTEEVGKCKQLNN